MFIMIKPVTGGWLIETHDFKPDVSTISGVRGMSEKLIFTTVVEMMTWLKAYAQEYEGLRMLKESPK